MNCPNCHCPRGETLPRPSQAAFFAKWRGAPVQVVRTVEDVAALVAQWRADAERERRAAEALVTIAAVTHG